MPGRYVVDEGQYESDDGNEDMTASRPADDKPRYLSHKGDGVDVTLQVSETNLEELEVTKRNLTGSIGDTSYSNKSKHMETRVLSYGQFDCPQIRFPPT